MSVTRRQFLQGGVAAFTVSFAAPEVLTSLARAQGATSRNLVVLYLAGGNDSLSTIAPYSDAQYYARRPTLAIPAANVLQIGTDSSGVRLGLHPRLTGLRQIFDEGRLAIVQRTGYPNQSRSHFLGTDIWSSADPDNPQGPGWLGRYLDTLPSPVDPLVAWNTVRETPRTLLARNVGVPAIPSVGGYTFTSPNSTAETALARAAAQRISSHVPVDQPHLAFVNATMRGAFATLDRVAQVGRYTPSLTYPSTGLGQALRAVAGAIAQGVGTRVFWVETGGYDTHSGQGVNGGAYANLMGLINDALLAFYRDMQNVGALGQTLVLQFSEFGRRITENGSTGTDHGAASAMLLIGGGVRGGIHGTAPNLNAGDSQNPTLENRGADVTLETDFRSVYATIAEKWLGANSVSLLGADFRNPRLNVL